MKVGTSVAELGAARRAVAVGTFDGVHLGHQRVIAAVTAAGLTRTVVTFDPHPRAALGADVELLTTLERRLELIAGLGVDETLVLPFTRELAALEPGEFAESVLRALGAEIVVGGANFRFGRARTGDLAALAAHGFDVRPVPLVEEVSSSIIRGLVRAGEVAAAARRLGRPFEVDGVVEAGHARGARLGFPTANVRMQPELLVPANGIYAGAAAGRRAAISIGTNPHYGGGSRTIEAFLLDFDGDLYGERLLVELWQRLRNEQAFDSEAALVARIARDVEQARGAERPA